MAQELSAKTIEYRKTVAAIEAAINKMPSALGKDPFPLEHSFADGLYIRKIFIPKGFFVVGSYHTDSFVSFIESGDMSILTEDGVKRVYGAQTQISGRGTKRFGFSHEDTVWVTVHANPTNERDLEKLDAMITEPDEFALPVVDTYEIEDKRFDSKKFVALTEEVFSHEKVGFWSDWNEEEQAAFESGDWEAFSRARGYTQEEIDNLREWIRMKEFGQSLGFDPLIIVKNIIFGYALRNLMLDTKGEILQSSWVPASVGGGEKCQP